MILATRTGNRELRSGTFGSSAIPLPGSGYFASSGVSVTQDAAYGLPAVSAVLSGIADLVASLSMLVYEDKPAGRERAVASWQYRLLHDEPALGMSAFQFYWDLTLSIEATGNGFVQKIRSGSEVMELYVLDPQRVSAYRDREGVMRYEYWQPNGVQKMTSADVLHIRGFTTAPGSVCGVSPIQVHRDALGTALALQKFEGHHFRHGAKPGVILEFPQGVQRDQAKQWVDLWNSEHQGIENAYKTAAVGAGGKVVAMPVSLEDASFVEAKRLGIEDVSRMFRWPRDLLELDNAAANDEQTSIRLLKFYLLPRLRRIERAMASDSELFGSTRLFPEFLTESLLRADMKTRNESYLKARQAGWMTANEIRAKENHPPHPDGDQLQATPVGGAPNPGADKPATDDEERARPSLERAEPGPRELHVHVPNEIEMRQPEVIVNVPEQPAPIVNVTVPAQAPPVVNVEVPEQAAPIVNVEAPAVHVDAPQVTVEPQITIEIPDRPKTLTVKRDGRGRISEASIEED